MEINIMLKNFLILKTLQMFYWTLISKILKYKQNMFSFNCPALNRLITKINNRWNIPFTDKFVFF